MKINIVIFLTLTLTGVLHVEGVQQQDVQGEQQQDVQGEQQQQGDDHLLRKRADNPPIPINQAHQELRALRRQSRLLDARLNQAQHQLMQYNRNNRGSINSALEAREMQISNELDSVDARIRVLEARIGIQNFAPGGRSTPTPINRQQPQQPRPIPRQNIQPNPRFGQLRPTNPLPSARAGLTLQQHRGQRRQEQRQRANAARERERQQARRLSTSRRNQIRRRH